MSTDAGLLADDVAARDAAVDVGRSFIVQAPAGSGKTELLIQRYLHLLAAVDNPEEILAITFTRKAAAEMRLRVVDALHRAARDERPAEAYLERTFDAAKAVLQRDASRGWHLIAHARRMRIQTLDSLNVSIARMRPLTSSGAGNVGAVADENELAVVYEEAAAATLDWLTERGGIRDAVNEVLGHLDNNTGRYVDYLSRMLRTRDQWLPFVSSGIGEPRHSETEGRLRTLLESNLERIVAGELARLAERFPGEAEASLLELARYAAANLVEDGRDDSEIRVLANLESIPGGSAGNTVEALDAWRAVAGFVMTKGGTVRKRVNRTQGFPPGDDGQIEAMKEILELIDATPGLPECLQEAPGLPPIRYDDQQWRILLALFELLPVAVAELQRMFVHRGVTDHTEIALAAGEALGSADSPGDVALLMDYQVRHILVDEMQDTSRAQYRMLEALTGGWQPGDGRTLFCVGDPMQSIYRFRNAEVAQFLLARDEGIGGVELEPLVLRRNFRSGEQLVDWFNDAFRRILPVDDDPVSGAVSYTPAVAADFQRGKGDVRVHPVFGGSIDNEADRTLTILGELVKDHPEDSVAVLVRSRTQLPTLLHKLREAGISYQAVDIDRLTDLPEIIDILALARALSHRADRVAWLALLRSPWVGLDWHDLHQLVLGRPRDCILELIDDERRIAQLSPGGRRALERFHDRLEPHLAPDRSRTLAVRVERTWFALGGPGLMPDRNAVENVYHFLDTLASLETGGMLPDVATVMDQLDADRVSTSTSASLQVMTMHKAKGLQFDHVVLYGLGRHPGSSRKAVLSWFDLPDEHGAERKVISPVGRQDEIEHDPIHRYIERAARKKDAYEQGRLLYVASTRARRTLHLIGNTAIADDGPKMPHSGSLLRLLWTAVEPVYAAAARDATEHVSGEDEDTFAEPPLRRFKSGWELPEVEIPPGDTEEAARDATRVDYDWVGHEARLAGTVVHRWLERIADGRVSPDVVGEDEFRRTAANWLRELGAQEGDIDRVSARVAEAVERMLDSDTGRWVLEGEGHAELALTGTVGTRLESVVIDRVRIDASGDHWIIDYKTSTHEGGSLEAFFEAEADRYRPQLERYRHIYRAWAGTDARCALYFPLLGRLVEVES